MSDKEQVHPRNKARETEEVEEVEIVASEVDSEAIDDLLDEIDSVLEENAEEFVRNYVQKGGE